MNTDAAGYVKYNRLPDLYAEQFIRETAIATNWGDEDIAIAMEIGCGPGNSTNWIDHYFPYFKKLIGIDIDPGMIDMAKHQNKKDHIQYHIADIAEKSSLAKWRGSVSRIFSNLVLHRVLDQKLAFENIFDLLEPGGRVAVSFVVDSLMYPAYLDLLGMPKWSSLLNTTTHSMIPESYLKKYDADYYKRMFEGVGFGISSCEVKTVIFPYESDDECKNVMLSLYCLEDVSDELIEEYKEDFFNQYMKHSCRNSERLPVHNVDTLQAVLHKKTN